MAGCDYEGSDRFCKWRDVVVPKVTNERDIAVRLLQRARGHLPGDANEYTDDTEKPAAELGLDIDAFFALLRAEVSVRG